MKPTTIGILAGMGPRSTSPFLESVLDQCQIQYGAKYDLDYPHIIVYSLPTPFYIDREIDEAALCAAITQHSNVPVLNIVDETLKGIEAGSVVTVFATDLTKKTKLYQEGILRHNCKYSFEESWQNSINEVILRIKNQEDAPRTLEIWNGLLDKVKAQKIDTIILACTDLSVLEQEAEGLLFLNSSKSLAKRLVEKYLELVHKEEPTCVNIAE